MLKQVVLTAAIMDCFHEGHKNLLEKMRERGEKVIVVLHDDLACYKIKNKFPVQKLHHRKHNVLLSGLADEVMVTGNVDPSDQFFKVICTYDNIVFMRGDDNLDFPGKWIIDKHKIPVEFVEYTKGVSSTETRESRGLHEG